ncbi:hypothetical protein CDAR_97871 [Caerostris darwini]|uniref:Uncharacterized protein n=1 Tax=Caerostris darwini TaxID=1538125 RepID=A0AAV4MD31_9ARAC|nr:hypothetical protein CDAR_97871 [Caerostris darwini]
MIKLQFPGRRRSLTLGKYLLKTPLFFSPNKQLTQLKLLNFFFPLETKPTKQRLPAKNDHSFTLYFLCIRRTVAGITEHGSGTPTSASWFFNLKWPTLPPCWKGDKWQEGLPPF